MKSLDELLKDFLDEVDYTLEAETPGVGDKDFYDRPYVQAKAQIEQSVREILGEQENIDTDMLYVLQAEKLAINRKLDHQLKRLDNWIGKL